jgi:hypothetical protein
MMLYLPISRPTPALVSFGIVSAVLGLLVCLLVYFLLLPSPILLLLALLWPAGFVGAFLLDPLWLMKPYGLYNRVALRWVIPAVRSWVLAVTFGVVFAANRPFSQRLRAAGGDGRTTWHPKTIEHILGDSGEGDVAVDETMGGRWLPALIQWSRRTRNWWVIALVPFMVVLRLLDTEEEKRGVSADTYTLY